MPVLRAGQRRSNSDYNLVARRCCKPTITAGLVRAASTPVLMSAKRQVVYACTRAVPTRPRRRDQLAHKCRAQW
jgi:arginine/lysine/ornithine decarboxylase